jgi:GNAT superfamily N-acetyltransferase
MTPPNITIDYLANHPELAEELARFSWNEWPSIYEHRGQTFADALSKYQERTNVDSIPLALVAFAEGKLVGTVSLKDDDLDIRPEIKHWLGGLFVVPEWRGRGVGSVLMRQAVEEARRLKVPRLFLWTSSAEGLYLKLGWQPVERTDYCGTRIVIMQNDFTTSQRSEISRWRLLWPRFQDQVKRSLRCPPEPGKSTLRHDIAQTRFARLRAETEADFLRERGRRAN